MREQRSDRPEVLTPNLGSESTISALMRSSRTARSTERSWSTTRIVSSANCPGSTRTVLGILSSRIYRHCSCRHYMDCPVGADSLRRRTGQPSLGTSRRSATRCSSIRQRATRSSSTSELDRAVQCPFRKVCLTNCQQDAVHGGSGQKVPRRAFRSHGHQWAGEADVSGTEG